MKKALDQVDLHLERGRLRHHQQGSNGREKSPDSAIAGSFLVDSGCILVDGQDILFMAEHKPDPAHWTAVPGPHAGDCAPHDD